MFHLFFEPVLPKYDKELVINYKEGETDQKTA
jgi:hypothetical protein